MKAAITMSLGLIAATALAAPPKHAPQAPKAPLEELAYAQFDTDVTSAGATVSFTHAIALYWVNALCELPIVGAENMRKYWYVGYARYSEGVAAAGADKLADAPHGAACWFPTLGGGHGLIYDNGEAHHIGGRPGDNVECLVSIHNDTQTFTVVSPPRSVVAAN